MTNTTYYKLTPISEKPEKSGFYLLTSIGIDPMYSCARFYSKRKECWEGGDNECSHYLRPVTEDEIVKENERLKGLLREAYEQGVHDSYTRSNKYFEDFANKHNL